MGTGNQPPGSSVAGAPVLAHLALPQVQAPAGRCLKTHLPPDALPCSLAPCTPATLLCAPRTSGSFAVWRKSSRRQARQEKGGISPELGLGPHSPRLLHNEPERKCTVPGAAEVAGSPVTSVLVHPQPRPLSVALLSRCDSALFPVVWGQATLQRNMLLML